MFIFSVVNDFDNIFREMFTLCMPFKLNEFHWYPFMWSGSSFAPFNQEVPSKCSSLYNAGNGFNINYFKVENIKQKQKKHKQLSPEPM